MLDCLPWLSPVDVLHGLMTLPCSTFRAHILEHFQPRLYFSPLSHKSDSFVKAFTPVFVEGIGSSRPGRRPWIIIRNPSYQLQFRHQAATRFFLSFFGFLFDGLSLAAPGHLEGTSWLPTGRLKRCEWTIPFCSKCAGARSDIKCHVEIFELKLRPRSLTWYCLLSVNDKEEIRSLSEFIKIVFASPIYTRYKVLII